MSEKMKNKVKEVGGEYKVPEEVINADWRDDIVPEEEDEFELFSNEIGYKNDPGDDKEGVEQKIIDFKERIGKKTSRSYELERKAA